VASHPSRGASENLDPVRDGHRQYADRNLPLCRSHRATDLPVLPGCLLPPPPGIVAHARHSEGRSVSVPYGLACA